MRDERIVTRRPALANASWPAEPAVYHDDDVAEYPSRSGSALRSTLFVLILIVVGAGSAVVWRMSGLSDFYAAASASPEVAMQANGSATPARVPAPNSPEQKVDRLTRDLEAMRQNLEQISTTQRQMAQTLAALSAGQSELKQHASQSADVAKWLGDSGAFGMQAALQRPATPHVARPRKVQSPPPTQVTQPRAAPPTVLAPR